MVARRSFGAATLTRLREMPAGDALAIVAIHVKADPTYLQGPVIHRAKFLM